MIDVTVGNKKSNNYYPRLMEYKGNSNLIVLFTERTKGIVLKTDEIAGHFVGKFDDCWEPTMFYPCEEPVTIRNM